MSSNFSIKIKNKPYFAISLTPSPDELSKGVVVKYEVFAKDGSTTCKTMLYGYPLTYEVRVGGFALPMSVDEVDLNYDESSTRSETTEGSCGEEEGVQTFL
jgi:hypothetical protein